MTENQKREQHRVRVRRLRSMAQREFCRHCKKHRQNRPRGLCFSCYADPELRQRYSTIACAANRRGESHEYNGASLRGEPLRHLPYSAECIAAMQERVARGEAVRQPGDAKYDLR